MFSKSSLTKTQCCKNSATFSIFDTSKNEAFCVHVPTGVEYKPLHFLYCVPVLKAGKESLLSKRQKFFSTFLKGLEDDILTCSNTQLNDRARLQFAWNHPDAKHRAMPQDTKNEDKTTLIYVPNREFN